MKYLVLFSGGQDSTTCLFWALQRASASEIKCVFFDYGQQGAVAETFASQMIAKMTGVMLVQEKLTIPVKSDLLTPCAEILADNGSGLPSSFVPGRNLLLLTASASMFYPEDGYDILIGANNVDFSGYPDCRPESLRCFETAINAALGTSLKVLAPLADMDKRSITLLGASLGATEALSWSNTCYHGQFPPCGQCPSCKIRKAGFSAAGITDPLEGE